jgi:phage N-6-adenine-methyltransferase
VNKALFTSDSMEWETPQWLFDVVNQEYKFDVDVCATAENAKCSKYFSKEQDGLFMEWNGTVWCNPPYGREIDKWVKKGNESHKTGSTVVMLLPARTDTKWIHEYLFGSAIMIFIKGRLKFGTSHNSAPFPSVLAIFGGSKETAEKMAEKLNGFVTWKCFNGGYCSEHSI